MQASCIDNLKLGMLLVSTRIDRLHQIRVKYVDITYRGMDHIPSGSVRLRPLNPDSQNSKSHD